MHDTLTRREAQAIKRRAAEGRKAIYERLRELKKTAPTREELRDDALREPEKRDPRVVAFRARRDDLLATLEGMKRVGRDAWQMATRRW